MKRVWQMSAKMLAGLAVTAMYAMPQAYTISAKPGVVNYIEGNAALNGRPVAVKSDKPTILKADDTLSTDVGKAEVLLTPGVFLRIGDNSAVRMVSPSLTDMQVTVERGEAMLEVDELLKDNHLMVLDHNASTTIEKAGLYRFIAGDQAKVSVIDGKAAIQLDSRKADLGKGHETLLAGNLKAGKFDAKKEDDLYAWSNVRSRYAAAASYQAANNVGLNSAGYGGYGGFGWSGFGFGPWYSPGWHWNSAFNSYAWLPGMGAFYNPFGYGFYAPAVVAYAPVMSAPIRGGGYWRNGRSVARGPVAVAVNPRNPPAGTVAKSPAAYQAARAQAVRAIAPSGFRTANGMHVPAGRAATGYAGPMHSNAGFAGPRGGGNWSGGRAGGGNFGGARAGGGNFGAGAAGHSSPGGSAGAPAAHR